jgi:putative hemolysin
LIEALIVLILIIINGFFSGAEIAIISSKRGAIDALSKQGNRSAKLVTKMKGDPDRFLATVQVGVTVVGTLASVIGGVLAMELLKPILLNFPIEFIQHYAEAISVGVVVIVISFGLLVIGELVPKSLALSHSERIACFSAMPLEIMAKFTSIFVTILTTSTRFVLTLLGQKGVAGERAFVSEEELKYFISEGRDLGIFEETEASLLHGIFEFADTTVREVMVAKPNLCAINVETPPNEVLKFIVDSGFSRYPVFDKDIDHVVGILFNKDVLKVIAEGSEPHLSEIMRDTYFVPDSIMISKLLREMQRRKVHMAMVVDEHGTADGLVTIEDILEEIVGEIEDEYDIEKNGLVEKLRDGTCIIDASASLRDLEAQDFPFEESEDYNTLAGLMLSKLQRLPRGGEFVIEKGYRLTIVDVEDKRIVRVKAELLEKLPEEPLL